MLAPRSTSAARPSAGRHLAVAFGFLTRLPVPDASPIDDEDLRRATAWFPFVGLVVGLLAGVARWSLEAPFGGATASVAAVAVGAMATGAFHEDGLADTFDGLWGGWTPERRIEIMRDSRIGTYGAMALLVAVLLQVSLLTSLDPRQAGATLAAAHCLGRFAILVQIRTSVPATDQGSGAKVADPISPVSFVATGLFTALVLALTLAPLGWSAPVAAALAMLAVVRLVATIARRRIGGTTGDVLGATALLTLVATLAAAVAVTRLTAG